MLLWLLVTVSLSSASNPGIQVSLNNGTLTTAFNLYAEQGLSLLEGNYGNYTKDFSYLIFTAHLTLENITLVSIAYDPAHTRIELQSPESILLYLTNVSCEFHANYTLKVLTTSKGWLTLQSANTNLTLNLSISHTESHPLFIYNSAEVTIGQANVTSNMDHDVQDIFQKEIDDNLHYLETLAPHLLSTMFPMVNTLMETYDLRFQVVEGLMLDLGIVSDVEVAGERVFLPLNGTFYSASSVNLGKEPEEMPYEIANLPEPIQAQVSDYTVNSAIAALWWDFSYSLYQLPPEFPIKMNTDEFALFIPQLRNHFGAGKPISFNLTPNTQSGLPTYQTNETILLSGSVDFEISCKPDDSGWQHAITFTLTISANATAWVTNNIASATVLSLNLDSITVANSAIGPIDLQALETFLSTAIAGFLPQANEYLSEVSLPLLDHILVFSVLKDDAEVETGYLAAGVEVGLIN